MCIIDGKNKSTKIETIRSEAEIYSYKLDFVIITPIYVFNDCNTKKMHNTFTPSKLLELIIISKNGGNKLNRYFALIDFYENDCLPLTKLFSWRNLIIILRRFREIFDVLIYIYKVKLRKLKIYKLYSNI